MPARRWIVLAGLTLLALILGHVGFERLPDGDRWSFGDSLHRSLQLFVLESGGVEPPIPWQRQVARMLAPAVTVYAAVLAALALFRDRLTGDEVAHAAELDRARDRGAVEHLLDHLPQALEVVAPADVADLERVAPGELLEVVRQVVGARHGRALDQDGDHADTAVEAV